MTDQQHNQNQRGVDLLKKNHANQNGGQNMQTSNNYDGEQMQQNNQMQFVQNNQQHQQMQNMMNQAPMQGMHQLQNMAQVMDQQQYQYQFQKQQEGMMVNQQQNVYSMQEMQKPQEEKMDLQNENVELLKLLQEGQIDNLTAEQMQMLHRYAMDDGIDLKQLEQLLQKDPNGEKIETEMENQYSEEQLKLIQELQKMESAQLGEFDVNKPENQEFIQNLQNQMQQLNSQLQEPMHNEEEEIDDNQLLEALQNQTITYEQLQQLITKGIDMNTLEMAGVKIHNHNHESLSEEELLAHLQNMQAQQQQQMMSEQELLMLQQELVKQNPKKSEKEIQEYIQQIYFNPLQEQAYKLAALMNNNEESNQQSEQQQYMNLQNPEYEANQQENLNQFAGVLPKTEENMSDQDFNLDEKLNEEERLRDMYFEQQLRVFYKNMMERLPYSTMEKLSKKSKQFCEHINKAQTDFIQQRKQKEKDSRVNGDIIQKSETSSELEANEENDLNSSFQSILYGQNSSLNPDPYITEVLNGLNNFPDLKNQFKRFLPEDEEEIQEMEQNVLKLKQSMNIDDVPMGTELDRSYDETSNIHKLKRDAYQNLFKLLEEYAETKEKSKTFINQNKQKQVNEALSLISTKIMKVAENYQKYVKDDAKNQMDQNKNKKEQPNYLQYFEKQMSLILSVIPSEIIDSYNVQNTMSQPIKKLEDKKQDLKGGKVQRPKRGAKGKVPLVSDEEYDEQSEIMQSEEVQEEESEIEQVEESNEEEMEEEAEEEFEEEMEEEQQFEESDQQEVEPEESQDHLRQTQNEDIAYTYRMKSISNELTNSYPTKLKELNKAEIKVFENLHKQMRSEQDWLDFNKLFLLYFDGIISLNDLFVLFEDKYGHRIKEELQKELEQLFPTRDHSRRLGSDILKPWNDLENQKFEKQNDSSYYKIDAHFPLPICSEKCNTKNNNFYQQFLNERYLSLSMGSENFKFKVRNINEDMIFKNEDEMYKLDTQIEMFEKCFKIIDDEIQYYDSIKDLKVQRQYEFPAQKLKPHMYFWEKRYKDLLPILMHKPFKRDFLLCLKQGLYGKLQELQNYKLDQQSTFQDIYRKNFMKSLDHRSFQYKDFIKKYLQKQTHIQVIRQVAASNQSGELRHINQMKGGILDESPYYHSFGNFMQHNFSSFDVDNCQDFPMNMKYLNVEKLARLEPQKFPHIRMVMKDELAIKVAIKMLCLNIRFSTSHHNNDKPRLTENCSFLLQEFLNIGDFKQLNQQCGYGKIENLTQKQVDMILNKDAHLYYKLRCQQLNGEDIDPVEEMEEEEDSVTGNNEQLKPIKVQIQKTDGDTYQSPAKFEKELELSAQNSSFVKDKQLSSPIQHNLSSGQVSEQSSPGKVKETAAPEQYKCLNVRDGHSKNKEDLNVDNCHFLPHYDSFGNYKLLYAPYNIFMFFKFFYALYERIVMTKQLIREKVMQDLSEIPIQDKQKYKICNQAGEIENLDLFISERFEYFLKGIFSLTNHSSTSQSMLNMGLVQQINAPSNVMDSNKFEDYSRVLLGKNAFLLFQVDKISNHALKQLHVMHSDVQCQKSFKLFKKFNEQSEYTSESHYATTYAHEVIEQFSLSENIVNAKSFKRKDYQMCNHTSQKFELGKQGMDLEQNTRQTRSESITGSFANNPSQTSISQSNFQVFRMLFSPESNTMSIHFLNMNPYHLQNQNYRNSMRDNYNILREATMLPNVPLLEEGQANCQCKPHRFGSDNSQPPIFLRRNLKEMQKHRVKAELSGDTVTHTNSLQVETVPQINQIVFTPCQTGEDVFVYKRKTKLLNNGKSMVIEDLQKQLEQHNHILKRAKTNQ